MKRLRLAIIGAWGHVVTVLEELEGFSGVEVVAIALATPADDLELLRSFAVTAKAEIYGSYRKMLREARPDVVVISTRLDRIAPIAIEAAAAECHMFCEKPLAIKHEALASLYAAVCANGVQCIPILNNCAHPAILAARRAIKAGKIGEVILVNARKSYKWAQRPKWFGSRKTYGGTIPWIGIHAMDFIHSTTGLNFTHVGAMHANHAHSILRDCEDNAALVLRLSNGGHATISLDLLRPDAAPTHGDDWIRIVGSRGVVEAHLHENCCRLITHEHGPRLLPLPKSPGFFRPLLRSLAAGDDLCREHCSKGFRLTHATLCARDAADQGRILPVNGTLWNV